MRYTLLVPNEFTDPEGDKRPAKPNESGSSEGFANWTVQMRKGLLDFCILRALEAGEQYGYALVKMLVAVPGIGVSEGSIYPLLSRLKRQGLVTTRLEESTEGPARKYYRLTSEGSRLADEMGEYFAALMEGVAALGKQDFTQKSPETHPPVTQPDQDTPT